MNKYLISALLCAIAAALLWCAAIDVKILGTGLYVGHPEFAAINLLLTRIGLNPMPMSDLNVARGLFLEAIFKILGVVFFLIIAVAVLVKNRD